jgi:hypothetical protein
VLQGSVLEVPAVAVRLEEGAHATLTNNILSHAARARVAPIFLAGSAQLVLSRNVFAGFGPALVGGPGAREPADLSGNFVIGAEPKGVR